MAWPLNFSLPMDEIQGAKLDKEIQDLEKARQDVYAGVEPPEQGPRPKVSSKSVWLATGLAALGSLLGARQAPSALARYLGAAQGRLDQDYALAQRKAVQDAEWKARTAERQAAGIDEAIRRKSRAAEQVRANSERKRELDARMKQLDREAAMQDARRRDELQWRQSQAEEEKKRWEASSKRLDDAQALRAQAEADRRALERERLDLEKQKADAGQSLQKARLDASTAQAAQSFEARMEALRQRQPPGQKAAPTSVWKSAKRTNQDRLDHFHEQKQDLVRNLSDNKAAAAAGRSTRYFKSTKLWWVDYQNRLRLRYVPQPTVSGKEALRKLSELDKRITSLRSYMNQGTEPLDPASVQAGSPPAWAYGPISLRPLPKPSAKPPAK